jgi:choline dehydrogenase-like flavoprotein
VLEAGGEEANDNDASRAEIVDPARHAPMNLVVRRALGGTSWTWGGRCVPYDNVDFMPRDFVADAQWPIGAEEIRAWYEGAAMHLCVEAQTFTSPTRGRSETGWWLIRSNAGRATQESCWRIEAASLPPNGSS